MIPANLSAYRLILASGSPRRHELMSHLDLDFEVMVRKVREDIPSGMPPEEAAEYLAALKASAFAEEIENNRALVIAADTIVCLGNEILGKPADREEAVSSLQKLSGKMHRVITGLCLSSKNKTVNFGVSTDVYFKVLRTEEITYYVDHYKPYDKAGAYGIQEWIGITGIEKINGSFYNVMGLPVQRLYEELISF